jgi:hypothetical protein
MGHSSLAGITSGLGFHARYDGLVTAVVPVYAPTTQCCSVCGYQLLRDARDARDARDDVPIVPIVPLVPIMDPLA